MQVGRGVEPDPIAGGLKRGGQHRASGSLAVGSRDEQGPPVLLGPSQVVQSTLHPAQSKPDPVRIQGGQVHEGVMGHGIALRLQRYCLLAVGPLLALDYMRH